ncbi:MAG: hypothetical protein ACFC1C_04270 [Candidatus Malihini olakiniferum]
MTQIIIGGLVNSGIVLSVATTTLQAESASAYFFLFMEAMQQEGSASGIYA